MDILKKKWKTCILGKGCAYSKSGAAEHQDQDQHQSHNNNHDDDDDDTVSTKLSKSKSWPAVVGSTTLSRSALSSPYSSHPPSKPATPRRRSRVPAGCFPVYVGEERKRFLIKAKYASHPMFVMLLEDAELEYGYSCRGPLVLPSCDEDLFCKVLAEMDSDRTDYEIQTGGCGATAVVGAYSPLTPSRRSLLKLNHF